MEQQAHSTTTVVGKTDVLLKRIARASAWALLAAVVVAVLSGWGITQTGIIYRLTFGLVDRGLADSIHRATNVPMALFFLSHVFINMKLMISRRRPSRGLLSSSILGLIGAGLLAMVIYMEYFPLAG